MAYYELLPSIKQEYIIYKIPYIPNEDSFNGKLIREKAFDKPLEFITRCTAACPPDDYPGSRVHVLSDRFIDALQNAGVDNMQIFDAILINPDTGDRWDTGYKAVNFVGIIDCVDMEKAEGDKIGAGMVAFNRIGIDLKKQMMH